MPRSARWPRASINVSFVAPSSDLVPPEAGDLAVGALPEGMDGGEFVKPSACAACAKKDACWGLRRGYVELHGDGEIRPM